MTKADIVNEISKNTGIEKVTVQKTVEAFMETVKDSLVKEKNNRRGRHFVNRINYIICEIPHNINERIEYKYDDHGENR